MVLLSNKEWEGGGYVSSLFKHQLWGVMTVKPAYVCRFRQASLACLILATFLAILGPNMALEDYFCRRELKLLNLSADS